MNDRRGIENSARMLSRCWRKYRLKGRRGEKGGLGALSGLEGEGCGVQVEEREEI